MSTTAAKSNAWTPSPELSSLAEDLSTGHIHALCAVDLHYHKREHEQEHLYKSKNIKGWRLAEEAWSCTFLWALWLTLQQLGSHS